MNDYYVGQDGYYYPVVAAWPWAFVGQTAQPVYATARLAPYDPTKDQNWSGARGLVLSTIQAVIGDDATFNRIAAQVIAHLRRQGFINDRANKLINRPDFLGKIRAYLRQMIYYMDTSTLIDVAARELFRVLRSGAVSKPTF